MAKITLKGNPVNTIGNLLAVGSKAPNFKLVTNSLGVVELENYKGKRKVLSIFPSLDTPTCATSVRTFNKNAAELKNVVVLNISADLPFAQGRFCGAEGIKNVETLSTLRSSFAKDYQVEIIDGPLAGLCSRAIYVLDENNKVLYTEQVKEIADEPNYAAVLNALK